MQAKKITVLGSGLVGSVIAQDLSKKFLVEVIDMNEHSLQTLANKKNLTTIKADVTDFNTLQKLVSGSDLVVSALPGFLGYNVLKNIINLGKNVADISFFPEDALSLNDLAKEKNVTAIVDCGVAPGMSNLLLGYHYSQMQVEYFECMVGGLPMERKFPFEYKAPFSPIDVIEEYTRPARLMENGKIVTKPALSELESIDFAGIGTLESFNTDGLRSILHTMRVPNMKEKTLRYPGHTKLIQALKTAGFFDEEKIDINNVKIKPIDVTAKLLKNIWKLNKNEEEFTIMRIIIKGKEKNIDKTYEYNLLDKYDVTTGFSSMSRTTGFTCAAMAHLILENTFNAKGIFPPELIGSNTNSFNFVMNYLSERNVIYKKTEY